MPSLVTSAVLLASQAASLPPAQEERAERGDEAILPAHLALPSSYHFVVGVGLERFGTHFSNNDPLASQLIGITALFRASAFGSHFMLMTKPAVRQYENSRFLAGLGFRGYYEVPGFTEMSYGVGGHVEARLQDHYWLAYVTPVELGAAVWRTGSWNIELLVGARRVVAGELINHFLLDPNGVADQGAAQRLDAAKSELPWKGFVRLVFGRRLD